ncbi:WD40/YVTN/BNR-like repeat-containing protein [Flavihumibacter petaseus]|uniref:Photosynthesis system II assembly factor Ycf48/Hcf136-like domain-containing protein n=1 Tax=Flavihumibacter petaseus NBRC 106054 TaxID=1220578 RepID=A0A0E9MUI1_9BACT|nr:YCF48-related protein [Flavihumibacter petaseus]GAO41397.1 hypothetical protein FPE01S_01_04090 [Flavihumibacter petaseus NBRC 106054]
MCRPVICFAVLLFALVACDKNNDEPPPPPPPALPPAKIEVIAGNNQMGTRGLQLLDTVIIEVTPNPADQTPDYTFYFTGGTDNGQVMPYTATWNNGKYYVRSVWTLGNSPSNQQVKFLLFNNCSIATNCIPADSTVIDATTSHPWTAVFNPQASGAGTFTDLHFYTDQDGIAVGDLTPGGVITHDGGQTWNSHGYDRNDIYQLAFADADTGIAVITNNGARYTYDGGLTFFEAPWSAPAVGHLSSNYFMTGPSSLVAVGRYGSIARSTDAGQHWTSYTDLNFINFLYTVECPDPNTCYAGGESGKLIKTGNGGITWSELPSNTNSRLFKITFHDNQLGYAGGESGCLIKTSNGGQTWSQLKPGIHGDIIDIRFFDNNNGIVVGRNGEIARTTDGGDHWTMINGHSNGVFSLTKTYIKSSQLILGLQNQSIYQYEIN